MKNAKPKIAVLNSALRPVAGGLAISTRANIAACLILTSAAPLAAAAQILEPGSNAVKAASGCKFAEGPVVDAKGELLLHRPLPEFAANVVFGGKDRRDLYVRATTGVYRLRTRIAGSPMPIPQRTSSNKTP